MRGFSVASKYLNPEQLPQRHDLKLSILDVKCTDARGTHYVVEMQIIEVEGFQKRVVYNACKEYATQLGVGENSPRLNDVIDVTLCDFEMWPQRQDDGGAHRVPMLSRWRMQEQHGGERDLPEVQYVFVELPKYQAGKWPRSTVDKWTYFFREARSLDRVPEELAEEPYAQALEVARTTNLTEQELTEYERQKMAVQDFRGGLSLAEQRGRQLGLQEREQSGHQIGLQEGQVLATAQAILTVLAARGLQIDEALRARVLSTSDQTTLSGWLARAVTITAADELCRP